MLRLSTFNSCCALDKDSLQTDLNESLSRALLALMLGYQDEGMAYALHMRMQVKAQAAGLVNGGTNNDVLTFTLALNLGFTFKSIFSIFYLYCSLSVFLPLHIPVFPFV